MLKKARDTVKTKKLKKRDGPTEIEKKRQELASVTTELEQLNGTYEINTKKTITKY